MRLLPEPVGGHQSNGEFSRDGRFVVYDSDETGRYEVFVTPIHGRGRRWQVSRRWRLDPALEPERARASVSWICRIG
jgi:Tol biopolymer transport system component